MFSAIRSRTRPSMKDTRPRMPTRSKVYQSCPSRITSSSNGSNASGSKSTNDTKVDEASADHQPNAMATTPEITKDDDDVLHSPTSVRDHCNSSLRSKKQAKLPYNCRSPDILESDDANYESADFSIDTFGSEDWDDDENSFAKSETNFHSAVAIDGVLSEDETDYNDKSTSPSFVSNRAKRYGKHESADFSIDTFGSDDNYAEVEPTNIENKAEVDDVPSEDETDYNDMRSAKLSALHDEIKHQYSRDESGDFSIATFASEDENSAIKNKPALETDDSSEDETDYNDQSDGDFKRRPKRISRKDAGQLSFISSLSGSYDSLSSIPMYPAVKINKNYAQDKHWHDLYSGQDGTYSGEFSFATNAPHGEGRVEFEQSGSWYEGDWVQGQYHGNGSFLDENGDFYQGRFYEHHKHGKGIMTFTDGCVFEGTFVNGEMANGKMTHQDGSTYTGTFDNGMRHGFGKNVFGDGSVYKGEFWQGKLHGHGRLTWADGGCYKGEWKYGEQHGHGRETRPDGSLRHDGAWKHGHPIRVDASSSRKNIHQGGIGQASLSAEHNQLGLIRLEQDKVDGAISSFLLALKIDLRRGNKLAIAATQSNLGLAYEQKGELGAARDMYQHALRQQRSVLGERQEEVARTMDNLARVYGKEKNLDRAVELFEESLEIKTELFGESHPEVISAFAMLDNARRRRRTCTE